MAGCARIAALTPTLYYCKKLIRTAPNHLESPT